MKRYLFILSVFLVSQAAFPQEIQKRTEWLPAGQLFPSLRFDPHEAQCSGSLYAFSDPGGWQNQCFANFSLGMRRNILRFQHPGERKSEAGLEVAVLTQFLFEEPFERFQVNLFNVEFKIGAYYQYKLNDHWSFRARLSHLSAHLGDDYIFRYDIEHFLDNRRIYEMIDAAAAWQQGPWMVYGDAGFIFHSTYERRPLILQCGGQWNPGSKKKNWISWLIGADLLFEQQACFRPGVHTGAGIVLGKKDRHPVTIVLDYYNGYLPYSLYDDVVIQWIGASLYFDPF